MFGQSPNASTMNAFYTFILSIWETFLPKQLSEYSIEKHLVSTVIKVTTMDHRELKMSEKEPHYQGGQVRGLSPGHLYVEQLG